MSELHDRMAKMTATEQQALAGYPQYFDKDLYLKAVEQMIMADELIHALYMLNNMPAWYREHGCIEAAKLKAQLYKTLWAAEDYAHDPHEQDLNHIAQGKAVNEQFTFPRYPITRDLIKQLNATGVKPHVHEVGPASFWMPLWLLADGCKFTYDCSTVQKISLEIAKKHQPLADIWVSSTGEEATNSHRIFLALEVIEHLWHDEELYQYYVKAGGNFNNVIVSTPHGCCFNGANDWHTRPLGHLRCYTPKEFGDSAARIFPNYKWTLYDGILMVIVGGK